MHRTSARTATSLITSASLALALATDACQLQGKCEYNPDPKAGALYSVRYYCDGSPPTSDAGACAARLVDDYTWMSHPLSGGLDYGAQRDWRLSLKDGAGREIKGTVYEVIPYIASSLNGEATQWVVAPGNLAEITTSGHTVTVHNDTCAEYFLRVVVRAAP